MNQNQFNNESKSSVQKIAALNNYNYNYITTTLGKPYKFNVIENADNTNKKIKELDLLGIDGYITFDEIPNKKYWFAQRGLNEDNNKFTIRYARLYYNDNLELESTYTGGTEYHKLVSHKNTTSVYIVNFKTQTKIIYTRDLKEYLKNLDQLTIKDNLSDLYKNHQSQKYIELDFDDYEKFYKVHTFKIN